MITDDESVIITEQPAPPHADPKTLDYLNQLGFRPFTEEW